jgi:hypothetical protein
MNVKITTAMAFVFLASQMIGCQGCPRSDAVKEVDIQGVVVTAPNLSESFLGVEVHLPQDAKPVAGARVYLAFDQGGQSAIAGCSATSDSAGKYGIRGRASASSTRYGNDYFLIVEKEGYRRLSQAVSVGPFSQDGRNTAWLKRQTAP